MGYARPARTCVPEVKTVLAENPVGDRRPRLHHRQDKRRTVEKVTGGARVEYAMKDGFGCNASHFAPADQLGKIVDDSTITSMPPALT